MSAVAGRVMPLPRGAYNANTQYHILDIVTYSNAAYIALQTTQGNLPTNTTYWQKLVDSATELAQLSDVLITNIQNGQTLIYNSTTGMLENGSIDVSGKADRVVSATNGNFAGLNANGNLTDSGKKASDFVLSTAVGTAAAKNVPSSGNASSTQVVMGNDTRLSDSRTANGGIVDSMRSLNASGQSHGDIWLLTDKYNVNGDGYFYLYTGDDSLKTAVYKAYVVPAYGVQAGQFPSWTVATPSDAVTRQIRNIGAGTVDLVAGVTALTTGEIYLVYE